ncbi:hypothetical protein ATO6_12540 [Oceanicola sp. 22II-s10i]|uniref:acetate--CoA ligase family protein n=1 Tax=Oceanicola sp. 22II-s10i TaxID=1317116 RepID=UPI000B526C6A|nr:acetate--CoA ligase family protein [Oceanicola sp. 22II-s10i]OWU84667.1 hypothetical protein ATO6_12540 [Oceanicola sp. 22II-s10i]
MKDQTDSSALGAIFSPRSVAIIGASTSPLKLGGRPIAFLKDYGFQGEIYPVNAAQPEVQGLKAYADVRDIPGPVDQAVMLVPAKFVEDALKACAEKGVKVVQVLTSGFAEADEEGRARQERLMEIVRETGIRITGPNALGSVSPHDRFCATFSTAFQGMHPPAGNVAVVTQSGAFGSCSYVMVARRGLGLSRIVATGNEADIDTAEVIAHLAHDPETKVICAAVESSTDGDQLRAALKTAAEAGKPVIFMKVGASEIGAAAAATHTGALAGNDKVFDTVIREGGAYRARSIEEMVDVAYVMGIGPEPKGPRAVIVSFSGGIGIMMADASEGSGMELPPQSDGLRAEVRGILDFAEGSNPLDLTAQVAVRPDALPLIHDALLSSGEYDAIVIYLANSGMSPEAFAPHLENMRLLRRQHPDKVIGVVTPPHPEVQKALEEIGVLVFEDPSRLVKAIGGAATLVARRAAALGDAPVPGDAARVDLSLPMTEARAKRLLAGAGLPVPEEAECADAESAVRAAERIGFPVVMKVLSPDIAHKTEVGGIALNLGSAGEVAEAFARITESAARHAPDARIEGVIVAPMAGEGAEIILGLHSDPVFGPMILAGAGGVMAEMLGDVSFASVPVSRARAESMVRGTGWAKLLDAWRGRPERDRAALVEAILRLSDFAVANADQVEGVEMNPILIREKGAAVLDALIVPRTV